MESGIAAARALRSVSSQAFAVEVEVDQREVGAEPVMVLGQASVPYLVEAKDPLQDTEGMFQLGPHTGLQGIRAHARQETGENSVLLLSAFPG